MSNKKLYKTANMHCELMDSYRASFALTKSAVDEARYLFHQAMFQQIMRQELAYSN